MENCKCGHEANDTCAICGKPVCLWCGIYITADWGYVEPASDKDPTEIGAIMTVCKDHPEVAFLVSSIEAVNGIKLEKPEGRVIESKGKVWLVEE